MATLENYGVLGIVETVLVLALGVVPRRMGRLRVIHDCKLLNKCVEEKRFSLDGIVEVAKFIKSGDWMASVDLKDGYEHVEIHRNVRKYFGACWKGETLRFARLGYGFKLSPYLFQGIMESVVNEINKKSK